MTRVVIVRHTLTDFNISGPEGRICGQSNPSLNSKGILEAEELADLLKPIPFEKAYSSNLKRATETMNIILKGREIPLVIDPEIGEIGYGIWEGKSKFEVKNIYPKEYNLFEENPAKWFPERGDNPMDCAERALKWLNSIDVKCALAVSHKSLIRLLLSRLLNIPLKRYRDFVDIKIGGITVLYRAKSGWRIEAINYGSTSKRIFGF